MAIMEWMAQAAVCLNGKSENVVYDSGRSGLGFSVTHGGCRRYVFEYHVLGDWPMKPRRLYLGDCDEMTLQEARNAARDIVMELGI